MASWMSGYMVGRSPPAPEGPSHLRWRERRDSLIKVGMDCGDALTGGASCSSHRRCLQPGHRRESSERGVGPTVVVEAYPSRERREALAVRGVDPDVGPLLGQGPVEPFHLAVG